MDQRIALITGLARAGTTLTCHLLASLPDTIALHEPMNLVTLENRSASEIYDAIDRFIADNRASLQNDRTAQSIHIDGKVPDDPVSPDRSTDGLRRLIVSSGRITFDKPLSNDFLLAIKHNAGFTAILDHLAKRYRCYAVVRNPLAVLASWQTIDLPVNSGHVPVGERLDAELRHTLDGIDDVIERQLHILDWFCGRFACVIPPERVIRYEDVVATRGKALSVITPRALALDRPLESRNANDAYRGGANPLKVLASRLLSSPRGAWRNFYSTASIERLLEER